MINKRLIQLVPETKVPMAIKVVVLWVGLVASIVFWWDIATVLGQVYTTGEVPEGSSLAFHGVLLVAMILVKYGCARYAMTMTGDMVSKVKDNLRKKIYEKSLDLGPGYQKHFSTSKMIQLGAEGVEQLEIYFGNYLPQFFYAMLAPLTLFFIYIRFLPSVAIVLLLCVLLIPLGIIVIQKLAKRLFHQYWGRYLNLGDLFLENLQGMTTLKVYQADEKKQQEMDAESEKFRKITMGVLRMQLNSVTVMDIIAYGGTGLGMILSAIGLKNGVIDVPQTFFMMMLASEFFLAMRAFGSFFHIAMNGMAASEKMFAFLDLPVEEKGTELAEKGKIQCEDLSFSYEKDKTTLHNVDLQIPWGNWAAFVGESGCGKSTMAKIISGELTSEEGRCRIGAQEIKELMPSSLRELVTLVTHNSYIFSGTVRDCLKEGNPEADDGEMNQLLDQLGLKSFFDQREGLDTFLYEGAGNLSGGQRQRLSLARGLLKNSPIYIFDEVTSNIDVESEQVILNMIEQLAGTHTVIMISHRLKNVIPCDQIFMMERGNLVEQGKHEELMAKKGAYERLFSLQQEQEWNGGGEDHEQ